MSASSARDRSRSNRGDRPRSKPILLKPRMTPKPKAIPQKPRVGAPIQPREGPPPRIRDITNIPDYTKSPDAVQPSDVLDLYMQGSTIHPWANVVAFSAYCLWNEIHQVAPIELHVQWTSTYEEEDKEE